ncbi:MAG: hypothetical protein Q9N02_10500, partial [Ghiorsea sp.]|nr:hypothetical protein [Ghiorsea sp.]
LLAVMKKYIRKVRNQYDQIWDAIDAVLQNDKKYFILHHPNLSTQFFKNPYSNLLSSFFVLHLA